MFCLNPTVLYCYLETITCLHGFLTESHHVLFVTVSHGGQSGAIQKSCGVFLSCLQTTLAQLGALPLHLWVERTVQLYGWADNLVIKMAILLIYFVNVFIVSLCLVPGFGPNPFGGPPGHMGPMHPGKNQVDFSLWFLFSALNESKCSRVDEVFPWIPSVACSHLENRTGREGRVRSFTSQILLIA